ncbi:MAG: sugar phosphate isomerase/epimerase [Oscillospiraceae bacterium]|nr:sugar phosphate isomerase/epimerase [Oscillospiraceae bacterium]
MLPIALALYSVRDLMEEDFACTVRRVKELGYDGVEFAGLFGKAPEDIKALFDEVGLDPLSAHVPFLDMMENPKGVLGDYAKIGCKYVAIPHLTDEYRPGASKFGEVIEGAKMLGGVAKELGITLLYHNHEFEFEKLNGKFALDVLYESVPAGLLQTQIDTCWVKVAGEDPAQYVRKYKGRAPIVHLKDFMRKGSPTRPYQLIGIEDDNPAANDPDSFFEFRSLGQGMQDIPAIVEASIDAGAKWFVVEQDLPAPGKTSIQSAQESLAFLKNM